jgi:hypothetical protein
MRRKMKSLYELGDDLYTEGYYELAYEKFKLALESGDMNEADCLKSIEESSICY